MGMLGADDRDGSDDAEVRREDFEDDEVVPGSPIVSV